MTPSTRTFVAVAFALLLGGPVQAAPVESKKLEAIVETALRTWAPPGLAVVVVKDDEVVYLRGLGVKEVGKDGPVTPDTLFAIASLTKAFGAASVALLVDDGKAGWDDKVRDHLPWFRLSDALADREVTLRDLLCHRTGLARHDLLWYRAPWSLEDSVKRLAHLPPSSSFRSRYEYNNLGYTTAGLAVARTAGMSWDQFVTRRLLTPLGMKNTVFTASAAKASKDRATPHRLDGGKPVAIDWYPDDKQVRAAGSIKSSARDMGAWLRLQLNKGKFGEKQIVSEKGLAETHRAQVVVPVTAGPATKMAEITQQSYGLGWMIADYRGRHVLHHGGAADGFRSRLLMVPKEKLGIVLLANSEQAGLMEATGNLLLDEALGLEPKDWNGAYRKMAAKAQSDEQAKRKKLLAGRKANTRPTRGLEAYAGRFVDRAYGEVRVEHKDKALRLKWSSFELTLDHFHFDTFRPRDDGPEARRFADGLVSFTIDGDGNVAALRMLGQTFRRAGVKD